MTTVDRDTRTPFPTEGMAIDLPGGNRVFVGKSMGRIGIAFHRPARSDNEQSVYGTGILQEIINGESVAAVMISWEAAVALCQLLIEGLKEEKP